ncbi:hypothetical protein NC653_005732 [Populus alba x Populus x berolinensis]|uniref:Uncharacterized protein n=1 Tax=Populus alba x Populus x berolinensis TaxID=444605 RepID=A0AAD6RCY4_9ROSI|nr:hypothetical protein NC653_005732 [Populus alba x Populus x berolinensis]
MNLVQTNTTKLPKYLWIDKIVHPVAIATEFCYKDWKRSKRGTIRNQKLSPEATENCYAVRIMALG